MPIPLTPDEGRAASETADPPTLNSGTDATLIRRYRAGEDAAATSLYMRYASRLRALAEQHCRGGFAGRFDADDIVQSVFRTFFQGVRKKAYDAPPGGEIWGLLLVLALNKIRNQVEYHRAGKRSVSQTATMPDLEQHPVLSRDESAATFLRMVLDEQMAELPESNRTVIRLRIEGYEVSEIAERTGRSRRTVERVLQDFRDRLSNT
jgi:RNA polymerase sigma-70 factor (ECF subfamily)